MESVDINRSSFLPNPTPQPPPPTQYCNFFWNSHPYLFVTSSPISLRSLPYQRSWLNQTFVSTPHRRSATVSLETNLPHLCNRWGGGGGGVARNNGTKKEGFPRFFLTFFLATLSLLFFQLRLLYRRNTIAPLWYLYVWNYVRVFFPKGGRLVGLSKRLSTSLTWHRFATTYCSQNIQKKILNWFFPYCWNWFSDHRAIWSHFFRILPFPLSLFWLVTQSFLGEERLRDQPKERLQGRILPPPLLRISPSHPTPETNNSPQNKTEQNVKNKHKRLIKQPLIDLVGKPATYSFVCLFVCLVELMILKSRVKLALSTNYTPLSCFSYLFQRRFSYSSSSHARDSFQPTINT